MLADLPRHFTGPGLEFVTELGFVPLFALAQAGPSKLAHSRRCNPTSTCILFHPLKKVSSAKSLISPNYSPND